MVVGGCRSTSVDLFVHSDQRMQVCGLSLAVRGMSVNGGEGEKRWDDPSHTPVRALVPPLHV